MSSAPFVLGVDGGGTKTVGLLADSTGAVLAREQVGATNPNVVGTEGAADALVALVTRCCASVSCPTGNLGAVVLGLAGGGAREQRAMLVNAVNERTVRLYNEQWPLTFETDARIALEGAFSGAPGAIVIAGTGSVVMGKGSNGEILRTGGWGRVFGDEGSGFFIGAEALRAVARDIDGGTPAPWLKHSVAETHGWISREHLVLAVYQEQFPVASLAPLVLSGAKAGDAVCCAILQRAATLLAEQIGLLLDRIGSTQSGVVFLGGLIDHETEYQRILIHTLGLSHPQIRIVPPQHPPAHGAVLMALQLLRKSS